MPVEGSSKEHHLETWEVDWQCVASSWRGQQEEESDLGDVEAKPQGGYQVKTGQ